MCMPMRLFVCCDRNKVKFKFRCALCCSYDLMQQCWHADPDNRPSFAEACKTLDDILSEVINVESPDYANHYMAMVDVVGDRPLSERYQRMSSVVSDEETDTAADETKPLNATEVADV